MNLFDVEGAVPKPCPHTGAVESARESSPRRPRPRFGPDTLRFGQTCTARNPNQPRPLHPGPPTAGADRIPVFPRSSQLDRAIAPHDRCDHSTTQVVPQPVRSRRSSPGNGRGNISLPGARTADPGSSDRWPSRPVYPKGDGTRLVFRYRPPVHCTPRVAAATKIPPPYFRAGQQLPPRNFAAAVWEGGGGSAGRLPAAP